MIDLLIENGFGSIDDLSEDGNTLLHTASGNSHLYDAEYFDFLLSEINIESLNNYGQTALIFSVENGYRIPSVINSIVSHLVKKGASLDAESSIGNTALLEALRTPRIPNDSIKILIENTKNFKKQNKRRYDSTAFLINSSQ